CRDPRQMEKEMYSMTFVVRVSLCSLALSLSLISPAWAHFRAPASTPSPSQSSDEETIRALSEKYGLAIAAGEIETMRQLWNPQSPNLASRLRPYQNLFSTTRIEFIRMNVTWLEVMGDKAVSHLMADERRLDKKTGAVLSVSDAIRGSCRSLEWIKT